MTFPQRTLYNNAVWQWILAGAVVVFVAAVLWVFTRLLLRRLSRWAERTPGRLDDLIVDLLGKTKLLFLMVVSLYAGSLAVDLPDIAERVLGALSIIALLVQAGFWGNGLITFWIARSVRRRLEEDAATATSLAALGFLSKIVLWGIVLLVALDNIGVDITALIAGLGISGIAIALAVQSILGDLFASLSIIVDKPFVIGDFIIVGELLGTVERVGLKTTRVRSLSGEQIIFSNSDLLASRIRNYKRMHERRIVFSVGVTYETPHEKLDAIPGYLREAVEAQSAVRFDRAHFKSFGAFSLDFETVYYMLVPDYNEYMDVQQAINLAIVERFADEEIEFAYPTQTLHVHRDAAL
ncbi:MAG: mechanosensitive ion channel family protein [Candidatus Bipolaricaulota bacterium]|nr:MAG: mechanosensitive ion channel family protein [Candidatus Bipolaricaulota bacterium]